MPGVSRPRCDELVDPVARKFRNLGLDDDEGLDEGLLALLLLIKTRGRICRGEDIVRTGLSAGHSTVLLKGVACRYKMIENGRRQIFTFQYAGDFCDLDRYVLGQGDDAVGALTDCSIGVVPHEDLERIVTRYPGLGLAMWRATMVEAQILRERLLNVSQRPALPRIANLLCEQMVRLETVGLPGTVLPITQVDLADAASLSPVHMNRTIQDLRELGVLTKSRRAIEIVRRNRLMEIGKFDGRYLTVRHVPSERRVPAWSAGPVRAAPSIQLQAVSRATTTALSRVARE